MMKRSLRWCFIMSLLLVLAACGGSSDNNTATGGGQPPEASAGPDQTVMSVTSVTLDGSGSSDPEGDTLTIQWSQVSGTHVTLSSYTAMNPTFTSPGLTPGTSEDLVFQIVVGDGFNAPTPNSADTVTVTVNTWEKVKMGLQHTIALKSDGTLWAWGGNCSGQVGQGNTDCTPYADQITRIGADTDWTDIAAGDYYNLALNSDGTVWSWGDNTHGQLGNGQTGTDVSTPTRITGLSNIAAVDASAEQSFAVDSTGNLYAWGYHNLDRLGLGALGAGTEITQPAQVTGVSSVASISSGGISTLVSDGSGTLYGWGNNAYGQLGVPDNTNDGGYGSIDVPDNANGLADVVAVACGGQHSYILRDSNGNGNYTLWSMGYNFNGELGTAYPATENHVVTEITAPGVTNWKALASGENHGLAVGGNGSLWGWGYNNNGQLGIGTSGVGTEQDTPHQVGSDTDWYSVSAWLNHSAGLKDDGTLWLWGRSGYGALGDATISDSTVPSRVGY